MIRATPISTSGPTPTTAPAWRTPSSSLSAVAIAAGISIPGALSQIFALPGTSGRVVYFDESNTWQLFESGGGGVGPGGQTAATVVSGETHTLLPTDTAIRFDTTGGTTATADMVAPFYIGQRVTFYWWAWSVAQVAPTINVDAGHKLVPFSGQPSSVAGGLPTTTTISTPGASFTLEWNGTEWMSA